MSEAIFNLLWLPPALPVERMPLNTRGFRLVVLSAITVQEQRS